jgi:hypothetical protein
MRVYYTLQDPNGQPFPDHSTKQTWRVDIPSSVNIGEMQERLGMWHLLDPSSLTMFNPLHYVKTVEESISYRFGSCSKYPLIVSVNADESLDNCPELTSKNIPISRVLQYLVTRDKKYKPKVCDLREYREM